MSFGEVRIPTIQAGIIAVLVFRCNLNWLASGLYPDAPMATAPSAGKITAGRKMIGPITDKVI
jgi:hypothetical protein